MAKPDPFGRKIPSDVDKALYEKVEALKDSGAALPKDFEKSFDRHHALPVSSVEGSDLLRSLYDTPELRQEFREKLNSEDNLILLSKDPAVSEALGMNQHRSNHPQLRGAASEFLTTANTRYQTDLNDLRMDNASPEDLQGLKQHYRDMVDRYMWDLKDGNVASFKSNDPNALPTPDYAIYSKDPFVQKSGIAWEDLKTEQFSDHSLPKLTQDHPWFQINDSGDFKMSQTAVRAEFEANTAKGIYDPGTLGPSGNPLSNVERALARDDAGARAFVAERGINPAETSAELNKSNLFNLSVRSHPAADQMAAIPASAPEPAAAPTPAPSAPPPRPSSPSPGP